MKNLILTFAFFISIVGMNAQEKQIPKDVLGYRIIVLNPNEALLVYDSIKWSEYEKFPRLVIDTINFSWKKEVKGGILSSYEYDRILSWAYFDGTESWTKIYQKSEIERSQEHWPRRDEVTHFFFGKNVEGKVFLKEEILAKPLKKGWTGIMVFLSISLGLFAIGLINSCKNLLIDGESSKFYFTLSVAIPFIAALFSIAAEDTLTAKFSALVGLVFAVIFWTTGFICHRIYKRKHKNN